MWRPRHPCLRSSYRMLPLTQGSKSGKTNWVSNQAGGSFTAETRRAHREAFWDFGDVAPGAELWLHGCICLM